ncbi:hypothetical protein VSH64_01110 [Amycolatopsis rhabdoformis]|uniref:Uncharacterized protein n=1 Tax=Amycolatopsis rhabdoformis TaxID=1448059 RepID=A0ABZ1I970_9PSEU|nr:hypothetical protein [Amycolatopsis rhabdoformis]WSE30742.1 hypothetical protein VSH64_01110 [Amycolatopsis rhabdoformis]
MSVEPEPVPLGPRQTLFGHAQRLHSRSPGSPLPDDGKPYPDDPFHRGRDRPRPPEDRALIGVEPARVLAEHFANPAAVPQDLDEAFHRVWVSGHLSPPISAVIEQTDPARARDTGRWLVQHATDRGSVLGGLALLAVVGTSEDIPLIRTISLLSDTFAPLAARALERLAGGADALVWLGDRVNGWGRVYVVEALLRLDDPATRPWLLRRAVNGDHLNGYFAGELAVKTALHEAVADPGADDELFDHAGRLMDVLTYSRGMGSSIEDYDHAADVLQVHVERLGRQKPTARRFAVATGLVEYLDSGAAARLGWSPERLVAAYRSVLDRDDWCAVIRGEIKSGDEHLAPAYLRWLTTELGPRLGLRAFADVPPSDE